MEVPRRNKAKNEGEIVQYREIEFGRDENKITVTLLDETMGQGLIGMISSPIFKENIAMVIVEDPDSVDYNFACLGWAENGIAPRVAMTEKLYKELKAGVPVAKVVLMHEIGHYQNGDVTMDDDNSDERRSKLVANDEVCPKEIKADAFAVEYLGKETVIDGLKELQRRILADFADYDEESVKISIKEIEIRIKKIEV